MKKTVLRSYARLIAACGVNIQKGQEVFIQAELDQPEFVTMLVEECYKLKAKKVVVDWKSSMCATGRLRRCRRSTTTRKPDGSTMWTRFPVGFT